MNRWKELDDIKTPQEWKRISYQTKRKTHPLPLAVVSIIVCFSLITVSAFHSELSHWLTSQFPQNDVHLVKNISFKDLSMIEPPFGYTQKKDHIETVYLIKDQNLKKQKIHRYKGIYKKPFSFKYVLYRHNIMMYDFEGFVAYGENAIFSNTVYLCTVKNDLISLNIKTGKTELLAKNARNPKVSPQGKYILINKNKKYWTIYDTKNHIEKKAPYIAGYALSNEVSFYDDEHIITYGEPYKAGDREMCDTIVIDSASQEIVKRWKGITHNASALEVVGQSIKNYITNKTCTINGQGSLNVAGGSDHYLLLTDQENHYYLYSIEINQYVDLSIPIDLKNTSIDLFEYNEDAELMIYTKKESYFVRLDSLFH